jgi:hypothetical protein
MGRFHGIEPEKPTETVEDGLEEIAKALDRIADAMASARQPTPSGTPPADDSGLIVRGGRAYEKEEEDDP